MACNCPATRKKVNWSVCTGSRNVVNRRKEQARRWLRCSGLGDISEVKCVLTVERCTINIMGSESSSDAVHGYRAPA